MNFLDLTIIKETNRITFDIFRKPTTTDLIIPKDSCHPIEQKLATIGYFTDRIQICNLNHVRRLKESNVLKPTIHINKCNVTILNRI